MTARHRQAWSEEDLRVLAWGWGEVALATLAERLGRTPNAVYRMAVRQGYSARDGDAVSLDEAARQMGYCAEKLREILEASGGKVRRRPPGRVRDPKARGRRYQVDIDECRQAVEQWHERLTVEEAARELGEWGPTLRRWLIRAGVIAPTRAREQQRVTLDQCRAVIAERAEGRERKRLDEVARALGASPRRLRRELRRAGLAPVERRWTVTMEDCRAVLRGGA